MVERQQQAPAQLYPPRFALCSDLGGASAKAVAHSHSLQGLGASELSWWNCWGQASNNLAPPVSVLVLERARNTSRSDKELKVYWCNDVLPLRRTFESCITHFWSSSCVSYSSKRLVRSQHLLIILNWKCERDTSLSRKISRFAQSDWRKIRNYD